MLEPKPKEGEEPVDGLKEKPDGKTDGQADGKPGEKPDWTKEK